MKFLKVGRVAIITRGRYAGKKVGFPVVLARICTVPARWVLVMLPLLLLAAA